MNIRMTLSSLALTTLAAFASVALQDHPGDHPSGDHPSATEAEADLQPITIIALRHAEKGDDDPRDPGLAEAGTARAKQLEAMLAHAGVTHVFATSYRRTQDTIAPLAAATGLEVVTYDPQDIPGFATEMARLAPGSVAVIAGHSNTTPDLVKALGGEAGDLTEMRGMQLIPEEQYNRLYVLTLPSPEHKSPAPVTTLELRYGE